MKIQFVKVLSFLLYLFIYLCTRIFNGTNVQGNKRPLLRLIIILVILIFCFHSCRIAYLFIRKLDEPPIGVVRTIYGQGIKISIQRIPDPPLPYLCDFTVSSDGTRFGYTCYRFSFWRNLFSLPMEWQVVVDGFTVHKSKQPVSSLMLGGMCPTWSLLQFSSDNQHYSFSTDIAYLDGIPIQKQEFDRIMGLVFLPMGDRMLYAKKNGIEILFHEKSSLSLPLYDPKDRSECLSSF